MILKVVHGDRIELAGREHGRAVDKDCQRTGGLRGALDQALGLLPDGEVRPHGPGPASQPADLFHDPIGLSGRASVVHHDVGARPGQRKGRGAPQPPGRARDQGCFPLEYGSGSAHDHVSIINNIINMENLPNL